MNGFKAILYEASPRAPVFQAVFGRLCVDIESPHPQYYTVPGYADPQPVYLLDIHRLDASEKQRLIRHMADTFEMTEDEVVLHMHNIGVPIHADDCVIVVDNVQRWID